jgi:hypothetical protein
MLVYAAPLALFWSAISEQAPTKAIAYFGKRPSPPIDSTASGNLLEVSRKAKAPSRKDGALLCTA